MAQFKLIVLNQKKKSKKKHFHSQKLQNITKINRQPKKTVWNGVASCSKCFKSFMFEWLNGVVEIVVSVGSNLQLIGSSH